MSMPTQDIEPLLRSLLDAGIAAVDGRAATRQALARRTLTGPVYLLSIGKAADTMTLGALDALGDGILDGLVITKYAHLSEELQRRGARLSLRESAHPTPDQSCLDAGAAMIDFVSGLPADAHLLVLVSGGASALVEHLADGMTLADLQAITGKLLADGYPIDVMNRLRRRLSCIKGGKLAAKVACGQVTQLLISDVPGDSLAVIGSGPLVPLPADEATNHLPEELESLIRWSAPPSPAADDPLWRRFDTDIIASSAIAQAAVATAVRDRGLPLIQSEGSLDGDVDDTARRIARRLQSPDATSGIYIWGGETTLVLPDNPGRGGRNQHLALRLATLLDGQADTWVICAGTDGTDGPTDDAGGLIGPETLVSGDRLGLLAANSLDAADSGNYLDAVDALVTTGPTGTNVMDLAIAWRG